MARYQAEIVIVGGGMVGTATALGLAQQGRSVTLLEAFPAAPFSPEQGPDTRLSALSPHSVDLLKALQAWPAIEQMRVQPYKQMLVWETPGDVVTFDAAQTSDEYLGYFVENRLTQLGCAQALNEYDQVQVVIGKMAEIDPATNMVVTDQGDILQGQWIIGADGVHSNVRDQAGIASSGWQYQQWALGIIIRCTSPSYTTWQQFTPTGPVAFLPMYDQHASLIWYHSETRIKQLASLEHDALKDEILSTFPDKLGEFEIIQAVPFPLTRMHALRYLQDNIILIGDAAHGINPLAGQGVNLGFKDVRALLAVFANYSDLDETQFKGHLRSDYERPRQSDNLKTMTAMDAFYFGFSNANPLLKFMRNSAMKLVERTPLIKQKALLQALGR